MAKVKFYTAEDVKRAAKVGKSYCSFQFIDGQPAKNHTNADPGFSIAYLSSLTASIMAQSKLDEDPEKMAENIKNTILDYYKSFKKES